MIKYVIGSDKQTVKLAQALVSKIDECLAAGNHTKANELIDAGLSSPNKPFRAEFCRLANLD